MASTMKAEEIEVYCSAERASVRCVRASTIICANGHELVRDFPYAEFWQYCCDCKRFAPLEILKNDDGQTRCSQCERSLSGWFLCSECKLFTIQSDNLTAKSFALTKEGSVLPTCPGCLTTAPIINLARHDCTNIGVKYVTPRLHCPFCEESLTQFVVQEAPIESAGNLTQTPRTVGSLAFLETFGHSRPWVDRFQMSLDWLEAHRPRTFSHWVTTISIAVGVMGIFVGLGGPVEALSRTLSRWRNRPPQVRAIDCERIVPQGHVVTLRAQVDDPDGGELRFRWLSSAGTIEGSGAQVSLKTDDIVPKAISTDLIVEVTVTDELGMTAHARERISIVSRNVLNNPPSLTVPPRCNCSNQQVSVGETVSLYALAEASNANKTLSYDWQSSSPALEIVKTNSTAGSTAILKTAGLGQLVSPVPVKITLRVNDDQGGEVTGDLTIVVLPREFTAGVDAREGPKVKPNHSPKLEFFTADSLSVQAGDQVRLWVFVTDPDGDSPLYYEWKASAGEIINKGDTATFNTAGLGPGQKIINVTISDGRGGSISQRLLINVTPRPNNGASPSPASVERPTVSAPAQHSRLCRDRAFALAE